MPSKPLRPCTTTGCGQPAASYGRCTAHQAKERRRIDKARGTAAERGYDRLHEDRFRVGVLSRADQTCAACGGFATVADHYPLSRRHLVSSGRDPNDPAYGRALCVTCHNTHTASTQGRDNLPKPGR